MPKCVWELSSSKLHRKASPSPHLPVHPLAPRPDWKFCFSGVSWGQGWVEVRPHNSFCWDWSCRNVQCMRRVLGHPWAEFKNTSWLHRDASSIRVPLVVLKLILVSLSVMRSGWTWSCLLSGSHGASGQ